MLKTRQRKPFVFHIEPLRALAECLRSEYRKARPFPHVVVDNFLDAKTASMLLKVFPHPASSVWFDWRARDRQHQPKKQGIGHAKRLDGASPWLQNVLGAFNSYPFLNFLETLTGIGKLLPDPYFHGGGIHQILSGGKLDVHTDFNELSQLDLFRRVNVFLYLNKDWLPEYGGDLEFWDAEVTECKKRIAPLFNRIVIFSTDKSSFHGHPSPLNTPKNVTRKSIALYYYTAKPIPNHRYDRQTDWREVGDGTGPIS